MEVRVRLANDELWTKFHENTTEMVVTKTGRKMFPKLEYKIDGLDANLAYGLVLQIEQVDDSRYKFSGGEWSAAGRGETGTISKNVMHHDGVMPGAHWMRQAVNFERVKITNNFGDANPSHVSVLKILQHEKDRKLFSEDILGRNFQPKLSSKFEKWNDPNRRRN
ncbi:unnamed protein product [Nippostrongylus brasiliensis]|uniref:T-box domain-containing protein n=1 Tax=Nippostrongylus brasiliensis TaxID=27835 RepID=A0A0N4YVI2_NIPBR|nr:unnamed protein product [Nippostrongylus brasiliensis]